MIDPVVGSALIGAGASVVGSLAGAVNSNSASNTNIRLMREQNEWNSAKNQRARLEEAGLNPYLMMSGGNAGTASSTPQIIGYDPQNSFQKIGDNLAQIPLVQAQIKQAEAQAKLTSNQALESQINSETLNARNLAIINDLKSQFKDRESQMRLRDLQSDMQRIQNNIADATKQDVINQQHQNAVKAEYDALQSKVQYGLLSKELDGWDDMRKRQFMVMASEIAVNYSQKKLNENMAVKALQESYESVARRSTEDRLRPYKVKQLSYEAANEVLHGQNLKRQNKQMKQDYHNPFHYVGGVFGGSLSASKVIK